MKHKIKSGKTFKKRSGLFVWSFVLILMAAIATGGVEDGAVVAAAGQGAESGNVGSGGGAGDASREGKIQSISFNKDETIRDALRVLSAMYQTNIVPTAGVDGVLGFTKLRDVTFEQAMNAVLGGNFEYEEKENLVEVFPKGDVSRMKHAVFALHYISAADARRLIEPVLSDKGRIGVTTPAETGVPTGVSISAGTGGGDTMSLRDTIVVYDYAENIKAAQELIATIDVRPMQVLVEATIMSATLTEDTQFGIDWQSLKGTAVSALAGISSGSPDYFKSNGTQMGSASPISGGLTVGLAFGDVGAFIRAVERVTDVTILANPKILAVNKQLGSVYIGDKIGYREGDTFDTAGNLKEGAVKFLDTGTKLSFRPYISTEGYIRMDIHAKNSTDKSSGGIPSESSAELVSNIMVKDGQTIVIGGLFQDTVDTRKTKIPLLGDLPIIGALFRGTSDDYVRKEVMVLLTPHIIEEPSEAGGEARAEDVSRKRFGAKEQMEWISKTRLAEDTYADAVRCYEAGDTGKALERLESALTLRPTYLKALRLKERIIRETDPEADLKIERILLESIEQRDTDMWLRR